MVKRKKQTSEERIVRLVILLITVVLIVIIWSFRRGLARLSRWGYLGVFAINLVSSATVLVPIPGITAVFLGGAIWNPFLVGLASGVGSALGELFGYFAGYGGRGLMPILDEYPALRSIEDFFKKTGFITTLVISTIPFPFFDLIGIMAGALNYPIWKFTLAVLMGRIARDILIAASGAKFLPY